MSAIYGRIDLSGQHLKHDCLEDVLGPLEVWGPDTTDSIVQGHMALAQSTLYVAPWSRNQRIAKTISNCHVVADAILDNRDELATALLLSKSELDDKCDTALIALAWERWGKDCVDHLIGDFAFAVVDSRRKSVFLARDHVGSRPFYWAKRHDTLLWSTDANIIISQNDWEWPLDYGAVAAFQANSRNPLPRTFFRDLEKLAPGHCATIDTNDAQIVRWWNPPTVDSLILSSPLEYTEACRALLDRAISDRIQSNFPIGSHLSGGIDSTSVAVIAARQLGAQGRQLCGGYGWSPPFSDQYPDMGIRDERRRIASIAAQENIPARFGSSNGQNLYDFFSRPLETEGIADVADEVPILHNAQEDGARVVLSGWGGDEAFSSHGIGYLAFLITRFRFGNAANFIRNRTRSLKRLTQVADILWWQGIHLMLPEVLYQHFRLFRDRDLNHSFLSANFHRENLGIVKSRSKAIKFGPSPSKNIKIYLLHGHLGMRMETWAAWSAPYRLQYRYPLTDRRLLEFLMAIPPDALYPAGKSRGLALAALDDVLPKDIIKYDPANEALRANARFESWQIAAERTDAGMFDEDCPWFDMPALRQTALNPINQSSTYGVMRFAELMNAMRLWFMWKRRNAPQID